MTVVENSAALTAQGASDETPHIRPARREDARHLAALINIAGEGIPRWRWSRAAPNTASAEADWLAVGIERAQSDEGSFSWRHAWVVEQSGDVAAMLLGYVQPDSDPSDELAQLPDVVRPLVELEALAPGSWYVNALAAYPQYRGQGLGSRLLAVAEGMARLGASNTLSIVVAEQNHGAVALYERCGYVRVSTRPIVAYSGGEYTGNWLLLVKPRVQQSEIAPGLYRHYKNREYRVLEVATHSETREKLVVYRALYGDFDTWVRPLDMFNEEVNVNGSWVKRFIRVAD